MSASQRLGATRSNTATRLAEKNTMLKTIDLTLDQMDAESQQTYTDIAPLYDSVFGLDKLTTDAEGRLQGAPDLEWVRSVINDNRLISLLDIGCGCGSRLVPLRKILDPAVLLAGCDGNLAMMAQCVRNGKMMDVPVTMHEAVDQRLMAPQANGALHLYATDWFHLDRSIAASSFDILMCTGYAFAHCITKVRMLEALKQFHHVLAPGGWCYIDSLRFEIKAPDTDGSCQEVNEKAKTYRGHDILNDGSRRHLLTISDYFWYPNAIRQIVQKKMMLLLIEKEGNMRLYQTFHAWESPLDPEDLYALLSESGFRVEETRDTSPRVFGVLARKNG